MGLTGLCAYHARVALQLCAYLYSCVPMCVWVDRSLACFSCVSYTILHSAGQSSAAQAQLRTLHSTSLFQTMWASTQLSCRYFCGPNARKTSAQAKQQKKRPRGDEGKLGKAGAKAAAVSDDEADSSDDSDGSSSGDSSADSDDTSSGDEDDDEGDESDGAARKKIRVGDGGKAQPHAAARGKPQAAGKQKATAAFKKATVPPKARAAASSKGQAQADSGKKVWLIVAQLLPIAGSGFACAC